MSDSIIVVRECKDQSTGNLSCHRFVYEVNIGSESAPAFENFEVRVSAESAPTISEAKTLANSKARAIKDEIISSKEVHPVTIIFGESGEVTL